MSPLEKVYKFFSLEEFSKNSLCVRPCFKVSHQNGLPPLSTQTKRRKSSYMLGAYGAGKNGMSKNKAK